MASPVASVFSFANGYSANTVTLEVTLLVTFFIAVYPSKRTPLYERVGFSMGLPAFAAIGGVITIVSSHGSSESQPWYTIGLIFMGGGSAGLAVLLGEISVSLGKSRAKYIALSFTIAAIPYYLVVNLKPAIARSAIVWLPLVAGALVLLGTRSSSLHTAPAHPQRKVQRTLSVPWKLLIVISLCTAVFVFALSLTDKHNTMSFNTGTRLVSAAVALLFFLGLNLDRPLSGLNRNLSPMIPLIVAGIILLPFLNTTNSSLPLVAIQAAFAFFDLIVWIALSETALRLPIPAMNVFGWGRFSFTLGFMIGNLLEKTLMRPLIIPSAQVVIVAAIVVLVLALVSPLLVSRRSISWLLNVEGVPLSKHSPTECVDHITQNFGLSSREREVLLLLVQGKDTGDIAKTLFISNATVRVHIRSIYKKTAVHSRQELLAMAHLARP